MICEHRVFVKADSRLFSLHQTIKHGAVVKEEGKLSEMLGKDSQMDP